MSKRVFVQVSPPKSVRIEKTVTEKRAPTDESVKLLREMEQSARDSVTKALRLTNNTFDGVLHVETDQMSDTIMMRVTFDLNGKRIEVDHSKPRGLKGRDDKMKLLSELHEKISNKVASEILVNLVADLEGRL